MEQIRQSRPKGRLVNSLTRQHSQGKDGGESGIRTRDTFSRIHTFQACAFNHSATSPRRQSLSPQGRGRTASGAQPSHRTAPVKREFGRALPRFPKAAPKLHTRECFFLHSGGLRSFRKVFWTQIARGPKAQGHGSPGGRGGARALAACKCRPDVLKPIHLFHVAGYLRIADDREDAFGPAG